MSVSSHYDTRMLTLRPPPPPPHFLLVHQERFAEVFGQDAAAESRRSQESFKKWLLAGMTLVTGVVVGSLIVQKRL